MRGSAVFQYCSILDQFLNMFWLQSSFPIWISFEYCWIWEIFLVALDLGAAAAWQKCCMPGSGRARSTLCNPFQFPQNIDFLMNLVLIFPNNIKMWMNLMLIFGTVFSEWILEQPCWMPGSDAVVATCNPFQLQLVWQNTTILHQIKFHFCKWKRGNVNVAPAKSKCVFYIRCQNISSRRESSRFCLNSQYKWRLQAVLWALKQDFALGSLFFRLLFADKSKCWWTKVQ